MKDPSCQTNEEIDDSLLKSATEDNQTQGQNIDQSPDSLYELVAHPNSRTDVQTNVKIQVCCLTFFFSSPFLRFQIYSHVRCGVL